MQLVVYIPFYLDFHNISKYLCYFDRWNLNNNLEKDLNDLGTEDQEEDSFTEEIKVVPIAKRKMAKWDSTMTMILPSKFSVGT